MVRGRVVLVVDDNAVTREALALLLGREGCESVLAANGQEALALLAAGPPPDLVLLDMLMPVLDGWQFLEELRRTPSAVQIPVIVMTSSILTREWAEANQCQGFLRKPIEEQALRDEVRRCLGSAP